jgi:hypothetical protein
VDRAPLQDSGRPYDYYDSYGYGYNYNYIQPYTSRLSLVAWFLIMVAAFILIFLIAAL